MSEFWGPKGWSWLSKFGGWGRAWWHNFSNSCGCWQVAGGCQHPGSLKPITEFWCLTLPACETRQNCFVTKKPVRCVFCVSKLSTLAFRTHVDLAFPRKVPTYLNSLVQVWYHLGLFRNVWSSDVSKNFSTMGDQHPGSQWVDFLHHFDEGESYYIKYSLHEIHPGSQCLGRVQAVFISIHLSDSLWQTSHHILIKLSPN